MTTKIDSSNLNDVISNIFDMDNDNDDINQEDFDSNTIEENFEINDIKLESFSIDSNSDDEEEIVKNTKEIESKINIDNKNLENSYFVKLGQLNFDENDCVSIKEFDQMELTYKIVRNPDQEKTDYFSSHCKLLGQEESHYETSNQLSKYYVFTSIEKFVEKHILPNFSIIDKPLISFSPFYCTWIGKTDYSLNTISDDITKEMFKFCSGMNIDEALNNTKSHIAIIIKNTYDGKKTISISLGIKLEGFDKSGKLITIDDYFTLSNKSNSYFHKGIKLNDLSTYIENINSELQDDINILKSYEPSDDEIAKISRNMSKAKSKMYRNTWESFPSNYKNLYYNLLFLSSIINSEYVAREHTNVQQAVDVLVKTAYKEFQKNNKI